MAGYRKLGRTSSQRKAMLRSLVTALLFNGKIVTTAKPKKAADPDKKAGAKRGAKTKDKGGAKAAS